MREGEHTGEYIWLRQAVTFTMNGQTRTLEIAIPVRPGAGPSEVEALLAQAESDMARLSRALDARVDAALSPQSGTSPAPASAAPPQRPAGPAPAPISERGEREAAPSPAATIREPVAPTSGVAEPARPAAVQPPTAVPARPAAAAPGAPQPRPAPTRPSPASSSPAAAPAASSTRGGTGAPPAAAPASAGPELSRPEFLSAVAQLGLKPKEAMDRLGVRTLEGLNLREALESLRRQMLRSSASPAASATAPSPAEPPRTPPARPAASSPSATRAETVTPASVPARAPVQPDHFDEEEDAEYTFAIDEEDAADEDAAAAGEPDEPTYGAGPDEMDEYDSDDVPDFGPPPGRASAASTSSRASSRAASPRASTAPPGPATGARAAEATTPQGGVDARAQELIKQMRSASAGGSASAQQRTAYHNIIAEEVGETNARSLVQGLWRVTPERLGPDQYDELISWGKQETFFDDVPLVLAALEAERQAEREAASAGTGANGGATRATPTTPAAPPPSARPRPGTTRGDR